MKKMIWPLFGQFWKQLGNFLFHHLVTLISSICFCALKDLVDWKLYRLLQ